MLSPVFGGSKNHAPALVCPMLNAAAELGGTSRTQGKFSPEPSLA